jgi:hypothetical protein
VGRRARGQGLTPGGRLAQVPCACGGRAGPEGGAARQEVTEGAAD